METFISILRGINVSGHKKILMSDLKVLYESLKFTEVRTYIQSGNVIFKASTNLPDDAFAGKIEKAIFKKYKFSVPIIIRRVDEVSSLLLTNPFLKDKTVNRERLYITFLSTQPAPELIEKINAFSSPPDQFMIAGKEVFLYCPVSYGETKLSNGFFEKHLKVSATTRNWNTVNKLVEMATGNE